MRPCPNGCPFRNTDGTAMIFRASTSAGNTPPSMASCETLGLSAASRLSVCTTSGQFWQDCEK